MVAEQPIEHMAYQMDIKTFCKRFMLWTAVVIAMVMLVLGLCFGKVIEENLFAEIAKWVG